MCEDFVGEEAKCRAGSQWEILGGSMMEKNDVMV